MSRGEGDIRDSLLEESDGDIDAEERSGNDAGSEVSIHAKFNNFHGIDREILSPSYYSISEPPTLLRSRSNRTEHGILNVTPDLTPAQYKNTADLTTLAIMEIDDVVVFPGSTIPLRMNDRKWIIYLGELIDDARGF